MAQATLSCRCAAIHLVMPDKAAFAEHNGHIWSRKPTLYGTIPAGRTVRFLLIVLRKALAIGGEDLF